MPSTLTRPRLCELNIFEPFPFEKVDPENTLDLSTVISPDIKTEILVFHVEDLWSVRAHTKIQGLLEDLRCSALQCNNPVTKLWGLYTVVTSVTSLHRLNEGLMPATVLSTIDQELLPHIFDTAQRSGNFPFYLACVLDWCDEAAISMHSHLLTTQHRVRTNRSAENLVLQLGYISSKLDTACAHVTKYNGEIHRSAEQRAFRVREFIKMSAEFLVKIQTIPEGPEMASGAHP